MDQDRELWRFQWLFYATVSFLFSALYAFEEARYIVWGKSAGARVVSAREMGDLNRGTRFGSLSNKLTVEYSFRDVSAGPRTEFDQIPLGKDVVEGDLVPIQYIAGEPGASRIAGNRNNKALLAFFGTSFLIAFFIFKLYREANEPIRPGRKPPRRA